MSTQARTTHHAARWARLLLAALDESLLHVESLLAAFRLDDPTSALTAIMHYQSSSAKALRAVQALENTTTHREIHARQALSHLHRVARVPLALAWALVSQLPHSPTTRD